LLPVEPETCHWLAMVDRVGDDSNCEKPNKMTISSYFQYF